MIDRFYSWPIRVHLIILIALLAIPSVFLVIRSGLDQRSDAARAAKSECLDFVTFIAGRYQSMVAGAEQLGATLSLLPAVQSRNPASTNALLADLLRKNPRYSNIALIDKSGFVWASGIPLQGKLYLGDRKHYRDVIRTGEFSSGEYAIGRATGKSVLMFGYPVKNASGELISVIGIVFDLAYAQRYFDQSGFPPGASFSLLDHQGIILIRNLSDPFSQKLIGTRDSMQENWTKMIEGPNEGTYESMGNDGRYRLVAYKKLILPHESKPYLYVRSSIPLASATAKANAAMLKNLTVFGGLFLLGLFLSWFIGKRVVANPVRMLKAASQQLAAGAETVNVSQVVKVGELGELARAFDDMAERLTERGASLRESEGRFRALTETSSLAVGVSSSDGEFLYVNKAYGKLFGCMLEDLNHLNASEFWCNPEDRRKMIDAVRSKGFLMDYEVELKRKDGTPFWAMLSVNQVDYGGNQAIMASVHDITDRKYMEDALRKARDELELRVQERTQALRQQTEALSTSEKEFRMLAEAMPQIVWITRADGWNIYFNQQWVDYTGLTLEESYGHGWNKPFHPDDRQRAWDAWQNAVTNNGTYSLECRLRAVDGIYRWWLVRGVPVLNEKGETTKWFGTCTDIEEFKRVEEQLRQSQKMEAIGTLAGGIAHDFNNILAAILGFTEMAAEDVADRPDAQRSLQNVLKSVTRARELVKQILAFSRKTSHPRSPLSLSPIIKETVQLLRASIPATIEISLSLSASSDTVLGSPVEVQQVLMNLATNASFAMQEKGGTLEISLTDIDFIPDEPVLGADAIPGQYVQLAIKDTGIGMSPQVMSRVFEPFFTTKEVGKGTGMGLAVVYGIVKDLQGTITVESEPGTGSTFRVLLPKVRTEYKEDQPHMARVTGGRESILFVDDEEMLVEWGKIALERLGYQVTISTSSTEALKTFSTDPSLFDLVVTDHAMPHMAGSKLSSELLKIRPDIPIVLCTGHSENMSREKAKDLGIKEFLTKPLNKQELAVAVRRVLDEKPEV